VPLRVNLAKQIAPNREEPKLLGGRGGITTTFLQGQILNGRKYLTVRGRPSFSSKKSLMLVAPPHVDQWCLSVKLDGE